MTEAFTALHHQCAALGTRLFTIAALDPQAGLARRAYSSHPVEYPVSGTKPLVRDGWHEFVVTKCQTFIANTPPEFARYFTDHALITSMGLGSCINIPVVGAQGSVTGTVNLLAEAQHFTPDRIRAYQALVTAATPALLADLSGLAR